LPAAERQTVGRPKGGANSVDETLFRIMFEAQGNSPTLREVWRDAYLDDYPEGADPLSFVTKTDLDQIGEALALSPADQLVDIGCGAGGPGSSVARASGARLTGIDASEAALAIARSRHLMTLPDGSRFHRGDFSSTGLPDHFADGVMSTDALLFAPDPTAAFTELARILKPGRRLAFTSFELRSRSATLTAGPIPDYHPALEKAGFTIELYRETPDWEPRMRAVFRGILERRQRLAQELGEPAGSLTIAWATLRPPELGESRRVIVVAHSK
jgi:ubiquinone/menaquinone biosynthesis C-methylase UbiE